MSGVLNPSGPEPPSVYWVRRGGIVIAVLVAVAALWWVGTRVIGGRGGGTDDDSAQASGSTTASGEATSATPSDASGDATGPSSPRKCPDSSITVVASTDAATYRVGATPTFTLTITNTGKVACKRDLGPKANSLEVTSGGYHVWSSDDCSPSEKSKVTRLKAGQSAVASITWDGQLSQKGCPNGKGKTVKAGRYTLVAFNGKVASDPAPFGFTSK